VGSPSPGTILLFLAGDPTLAERQASQPEMRGGFARFFLPAAAFGTGPEGSGARRAADPAGPTAFPPEQLMCAQRLIDLARKLGRKVQVIDVNRPEDARALVERYVGPDDVLPIAVRSDGERLEGEEAFTPAVLRGFLSVA